MIRSALPTRSSARHCRGGGADYSTVLCLYGQTPAIQYLRWYRILTRWLPRPLPTEARVLSGGVNAADLHLLKYC